jgi:3-hydroxybutyryl-CoA dehydrogenase
MASLKAIGIIGNGQRADTLARAVDASPLGLVRLGSDPEGSDWTEIGDADVVVEALDDDLASTDNLLRAVSAVVASTVVIVSSTATLSIGRLARCVVDPGRFAGLHVFADADEVRLFEVVPSERTRPETLARLRSTAAQLGIPSVVTKDRPGFLVNRLLLPYLNQAIEAYDNGIASARDIDLAVELGLGYPVGPLHLLDELGLDEHVRVTSAVYDGLGDWHFAPPPLLGRLADANRLGARAGSGFFAYPPTADRLSEVAAVKQIIYSYAEAINTERWNDLLELFSEDATISSPLASVTGHKGILRWFQATADRFAPHVDKVVEVLADGTLDAGLAAATIEVHAVERDGTVREFTAADDFVIEGGRIRRLRMVFDTREFA